MLGDAAVDGVVGGVDTIGDTSFNTVIHVPVWLENGLRSDGFELNFSSH